MFYANTMIALLLFLLSSAQASQTPYTTEVENRFNALEQQSTSGLLTKKIARAQWDASTQGTSGTAYDLGVTLPAKAIIQRSYWISDLTPVSAGNGTLALHCISAGDIFAAATVIAKTTGTLVEGVSDGTAANMKLGTTACAITATIASASFTAGKALIFVEYVVDN